MLDNIVERLRSFPLTAPIVAAVDTAVRVLKGNVAAFLAEPWVVLAATATAVNEATDGGIVKNNWKAWLAAYAVALGRYFTSPVFEKPAA